MARIVTNVSSLTVYKSYSRNNRSMAASAERLATGLRINRAADDAAGLAISETMRAQVRGADMAIENINNAINFINTADGYLQNISDILGRLEELAVEYIDGTKSTADKSNIDVEFVKLTDELENIADERAKFNGQKIFQNARLTLQVGPDAGQTFVIASASRNLLGVADFTSIAVSGGVSLAAKTVDDVQKAVAAVSTFRATLGSFQSQLQFTQAGLENYSENIAAAESRIRNVDVAKESTAFSRYQIQVQASTAMLAQANALPQNVLQLLAG